MDIRQLAALVAVADHGTFSAAAAALHTVQSNVSAHVARLEAEVGATLVDRAAGRLTAEGEAVVERARRINREMAALVADVQAIRHDVRGNVDLGVIGTTGRWLVPMISEVLSERHPGVALRVSEGTTATLSPRLVSGELDLAIITLPEPEGVRTEPLFDEDLLLVVPAEHRLAGESTVDMRDLDGLELFLPAPGTIFRNDIDEACRAAGITLVPKAELDGVRLLASLSFEGVAPAIVPATAIPGWLPAVRWHPVGVTGLPQRRIGMAWRSRALPSAPARSTAEVIHELVVERAGEQPGVTVTARTA